MKDRMSTTGISTLWLIFKIFGYTLTPASWNIPMKRFAIRRVQKREYTRGIFWLKSAKPGVTPLIINAPISTAVALSPGIPRERAGIKAPPVHALFATSGANTPSRHPVPGLSSLPLECSQIESAALRLMKTAMEAPVPGMAPIRVPIPRLERIIFHMEMTFLKGGKTFPMFSQTSPFFSRRRLSISKNTWLTP